MVSVVEVLVTGYLYAGIISFIFLPWSSRLGEVYYWIGGGIWIAYVVLAVVEAYRQESAALVVLDIAAALFWAWRWRKDRDDDDDRWKRLRKKLSEKVSVLDGRLVVRPVSA